MLATAKMAALSVVLLANPIGLVIAAVAALGAAAYLLYDNWDGVVKFFEDTWQGIKDAFDFEWLNNAGKLHRRDNRGRLGGGGGPAGIVVPIMAG